jgi:virulence factor Mce-like protein
VTRRRFRKNPVGLYAVIGTVITVVLILGVYVSYNSIHGVPWQSVYHVAVDVPNADRLVSTDDVRVHGVLSGSVASVTAMPSSPAGPAYARAELNIDPSVGRLPVDTKVEVGLSSALGATYVNLMPGTSTRTVADGGHLPLANTKPTVDLVDLFDIFKRSTRRSIDSTLADLGDGLAGRGPALNVAIGGLSELLAPLTRVEAALAAPPTHLSTFLHAYESFVGALGPVAVPLAQLFGRGATTFAAFDRVSGALADTIDTLPSTESAATSGLTAVQPALGQLATLAVELRPGGALLPRALDRVGSTLTAGVRPLREIPPFAGELRSTLSSLERVTRQPSTDGAVRKLASLVAASEPLLSVLTPAQVNCDVISLFGINFSKVFSLGGGGTQGVAMLALQSTGAQASIFQHAAPSPDLALNYLPHEDAQQCESGNEPPPGPLGPPQLTNPPGDQSRLVPKTAPPPGVTALAQRAGLLNAPPGTPR